MTMPRGIVADDVFVDEDKTKLLSSSSFLFLFGAPLKLNFFLHGVVTVVVVLLLVYYCLYPSTELQIGDRKAPLPADGRV